MKRYEQLMKLVKTAGLSDELAKIFTIAKENIGCDLEGELKNVLDNRLELRTVWEARYQDRWMKRTGKGFWLVFNENAPNAVASRSFNSYESAKAALDAKIAECNKGARVKNMDCNGIGIDVVIDEDSAHDMEIVHWEISRQFKSKWEVVETDALDGR